MQGGDTVGNQLKQTVRIEPQGRVIEAGVDQTILDAALAAGLNLPHSCKSGHCASCRARLITGQIAYPRDRRPLGLSESEASTGHILLCQARARSALTIEARVVGRIGEVEIKTLPCRIERMLRKSADVMQVFLRLPAVEPLLFQPGQYLDVMLADDERRSFSIASPPHDAALIELHIRHAPAGKFTSELFERTGAGALLRIEGPLGQFAYRPSAAPLLLVAGGTGFAPMKSILRHVLETGIDRPVHLYWGARSSSDLYEDELVLDWVRRYPQLRYVAALSDVPATNHPHERLGWVHDAVLADYADLSGIDIYAAGPPALVHAVRESFPAHQADPQRIFFDSFDYAPRPPGAS